jgi:peptidoglycan/xylan/chitin deacetylase (PgdA/CDA1 family)
LNHIKLPILGYQAWATPLHLNRIIQRFVEILKRLPEDEKQRIIKELPELLKVAINLEDFNNLMMDWDQVRNLSTRGIYFGGHTKTHPILSQVNDVDAKVEILGSKDRIEREINQPVISFAYPNGQKGDFNQTTKSLVSSAGYLTAFTLITGPQAYQSIREDPYEIDRIFISPRDTIARFAVKVSGLGLLGRG